MKYVKERWWLNNKAETSYLENLYTCCVGLCFNKHEHVNCDSFISETVLYHSIKYSEAAFQNCGCSGFCSGHSRVTDAQP